MTTATTTITVNVHSAVSVLEAANQLCRDIDSALNINDEIVNRNKATFCALFNAISENVKNRVLENASNRVKDEYLYTVLLPLD